MNAPDLIITTQRLVTDAGVAPGSVHIAGGRIVHVGPPAGNQPGALVLDVGTSVVMPGLVDTHVHVNEPGRTEWEGFRSAGRAAAAGGVTSMMVMPLNCTPAATSARALLAEADAARGKCLVDYGLWGGLVAGNASELDALWEAGALGFKCFLTDSGVDDFPRVELADLECARPVLERLGAVLLAHAEDPDALNAARAPSGLDANPRNYRAYVASRPPEAEVRSVQTLIGLAREMKRGRLHVVHVSAAEVIPLLRDARRDALPVTAETCPHYLALCSEDIEDGRTAFKCAPPIRGRENREQLWRALEEGILDMVVSDHSPCPPELKRLDEGDFAQAWGGISSLQLGVPIVWTHARARSGSLASIARWMSQAPARLAGLERSKGRLAAGFDADLVVWDPDASMEVHGSTLQHRHPLTPYEGARLQGVVQSTFVRGQQVYAGAGFERLDALDADGFREESAGQWLKRKHT